MGILRKFGEAIRGKLKRHRKLAIGGLSVLLALGLVLSGIQFGLLPIGSSQHGGLFTIGQHEVVLTIGTAEAATATDFTCDGTADDVQFQLALNTLPNTGGKLEVLGGTYNFTATVSRNRDDITIEGVGIATYFAYNGASAIFSAGSQSGWMFSNFSTDTGGISIGSATNLTVWNVKVGSTYLQNVTAYGTYIGASGTPDYVVGVNTATDDVPGSSGYWVKSGSTGQVVRSTASPADDDIQWAIDALPVGGGHVQCSSGTMSIEVAVVFVDGLVLNGQGESTILVNNLIGYGGVLYGLNFGDVKITNLAINQNSNHIAQPWYFDTGNSLTLDHVKVYNGDTTNPYSAPYQSNIGRLAITNSWFESLYLFGIGSGVEVTAFDEVIFTNNHLENTGADGLTISFGQRVIVTGNHITNTKTNGIDIGNSREVIVSGNIIWGLPATTNGIYIEGAAVAGWQRTINIVNNIISGLTWPGSGIVVNDTSGQAVDVNIIGNNLYDIATYGITCGPNGSRYNIIGNTMDTVACTGILLDADNSTVQSNYIYNWGNGYPAIRLDGSSYVQVKDNFLDGVAAAGREGIKETGASDYNVVEGNRLLNINNLMIILGTHTIVRDNFGYVTENSGTAIILNGNITVVVTHGLATTPTFISLTGTQAEVKDCIATSVGATYFTITASANVTDNRTVYWRAAVGAGN